VTPVVILCTILLFVVIVLVFFAFPFGFEGSTMFTYIKQWSTYLTDTVGSVLVRLQEHFWFYVPLGLIGLWRWLTWGFKSACAEYYRPINVQPFSPRPSLCIITPVYNENPQIFR
jgi:cellulose synthase/poly-beta-1,6-N-acetylglucosamine synthase-like glycosyltransferase